MARKPKDATAPATPKAPGRLKQMGQVFQMTRRHDPAVVWMLLLAFIAPTAAVVGVGLLLSGGNGWIVALWSVLAVLTGLLVALIVLGRRAEKAAYEQIEGQPGAVGAVLRTGIRGGWMSSEMPVAISKQQDALYRCVGKGGIVLIAEGDAVRTAKLVTDERRRVERAVPNVPITVISIGFADDEVRLSKLSGSIRKLKKKLTKAEVYAVNNRLNALQNSLPIPKGIDPTKARMPRGKVR